MARNFEGSAILPLLLAGATLIVQSAVAHADKCLFVSSYHSGYEWSDGIERGLRSVLHGRCEIKRFEMDTKRYKSEEDKVSKGKEAKALIEQWRPDVVITADDNAAKYLIQPFFKDKSQSVVFCGVNWTAKEYGFPYSNVTGMVEIAPIRPMLQKAVDIIGSGRRALYLGAHTLTEEKNLQRFRAATAELGITLDDRLVSSTEDWIASYLDAQGYDFVIVGSSSGINDWNEERAKREVRRSSRRLSVTNHEWMMSLTMLGLTKIPEEQGEWAGKAALEILAGMPPSEIPVVANRKWDLWLNETLVQSAGIVLPRSLKYRAKRYQLQ